MGEKTNTRLLDVKFGLAVSKFIWPDFVSENGCVFLAQHAGSNPPPANDTATGWESFVNHTHIFDEFKNDATNHIVVEVSESLNIEESLYNETHPDFAAACELGKLAAKLWALKLKQDFPSERFRVYYTEFDNPIVRFHKVRTDEFFWIDDEGLSSASDPSFRNSIIYDTSSLDTPICGPRCAVN